STLKRIRSCRKRQSVAAIIPPSLDAIYDGAIASGGSSMGETTSADAEQPSAAHRTLRAIIPPFAAVAPFGIAGLPFLILGAILWRLGLFYGFTGPLSLVTLTVPALQEFGRQVQSMSGIDGVCWCLSLLTLAFWLCAWQRAVATQFRERLGVWLAASLRLM